jgi:hypothetical protein
MMELTFDYQDIKRVFEIMNITIDDVYFAVKTENSGKQISAHMYWIGQPDVFNYYQDLPCEIDNVYLEIKGKWCHMDYDESDFLIYQEIIDWLKRQKHVKCRYFIDGTGTGSIGDPEGPFS